MSELEQTISAGWKRQILLLLRWVVPGISLSAVVYALFVFNWRELKSALIGLPYGGILSIAVAATLLVFVVCALRWSAINRLPWRMDSLWQVYVYSSLVIGTAMATPFQLGDLFKVKMAQASGLALGRSTVNLVIERIFDICAMLALALSGLVYRGTASYALAGLTGCSILLAPMVALSAIQLISKNLKQNSRLFVTLREAIGPPLPLATRLQVSILTVFKWGLTAWAWIEILSCVGVSLNLLDGFFLIGTVTALSLASMAPAGLGVQEISTRAILIGMGFEPVQADTAAIVLRIFTPVMIVLGLAHAVFLGKKMRPQAKENQDD
jgi:uncharacterized membrane protein YbhN (UPF0104 family)